MTLSFWIDKNDIQQLHDVLASPKKHKIRLFYHEIIPRGGVWTEPHEFIQVNLTMLEYSCYISTFDDGVTPNPENPAI